MEILKPVYKFTWEGFSKEISCFIPFDTHMALYSVPCIVNPIYLVHLHMYSEVVIVFTTRKLVNAACESENVLIEDIPWWSE